MRRAVRRAQAVLLWPQVVGVEVARFTTAKVLRDGVLFVEVSDSETSMHLMLQRQKFLNVYRAKFGVREVREIRFQVGRQPNKPEAPPPAPVKVEAQDLSRLAKNLGILRLPEKLAGPAMRAGKAMLAYQARKRAEGWRPCRLCGVLTDSEELCITCQRYAESTKVQRASRSLAISPEEATPHLSPDERKVAVYLAEAYLEALLPELLPQVLAEPTFKSHLERISRCLLALRLGKATALISEDDLDLLDHRVARALGRWR